MAKTLPVFSTAPLYGSGCQSRSQPAIFSAIHTHFEVATDNSETMLSHPPNIQTSVLRSWKAEYLFVHYRVEAETGVTEGFVMINSCVGVEWLGPE